MTMVLAPAHAPWGIPEAIAKQAPLAILSPAEMVEHAQIQMASAHAHAPLDIRGQVFAKQVLHALPLLVATEERVQLLMVLAHVPAVLDILDLAAK